MYCSKCGSQIPEGARFCNACGQDMQTGETTPAAASYDAPAPDAANATGGNAGGAKKRPRIVVIAAAVAFIILAGVLVYANMWRFMSPKSYYGYLESKNNSFSFNKLYKDLVKVTEVQPVSKEIRFTVGETGDMGYIAEGLDPEELSLTAKIDSSRDKAASYLRLNYYDNVLLDAMIYKDKDTIGFGLPLLYDKKFSFEIKEIRDVISNLSGEEVPEISGLNPKSIEELKKELDADTKFMDEKTAEYIKLAYTNIPSDSFKMSKSYDAKIYTWKSGSKKRAAEYENCRLIELELTEGDVYIIMDKVLEALGNDDKMLEFINKYRNGAAFMEMFAFGYGYDMTGYEYGIDTNAAIEEMKENLKEGREELEYTFDPESDEVIMKMKVIADKNNNILSREIIIDESSVVLSTYTDKDGSKITEIIYTEEMPYGEEPTMFHFYEGQEGKGLIALGDGDKLEVSYSGKDKGKSGIGLEYGTYKLRFDSYDSIEAILTVDKDDSGKNTDKLKLRISQDGDAPLVLNASVMDLKDKKELKFNKKEAIDLADVNMEELEEIVSDIEESFYEIMEKIS